MEDIIYFEDLFHYCRVNHSAGDDSIDNYERNRRSESFFKLLIISLISCRNVLFINTTPMIFQSDHSAMYHFEHFWYFSEKIMEYGVCVY